MTDDKREPEYAAHPKLSEQQQRAERIDTPLARQLGRSIERNARLVAALQMTLAYIDTHLIEITDKRAAQALLIAIDRALKGEADEARPATGDAAGADRKG